MSDGEKTFFNKLGISLQQYEKFKRLIDDNCLKSKTCIMQKEGYSYLCPAFKQQIRAMVKVFQIQQERVGGFLFSEF